MTNWLWAIPWLIIIIFYAGWYFGGKVAVRKENREQRHELDIQEIERSHNRTISELYKHIDNLESKIERIYATRIKEEKNNG